MEGKLIPVGHITGTLNGAKHMNGQLHVYVPYETYIGDSVFVPTDQEQKISLNGKVLRNDITIKPIPNNYGKIAFDGGTLSVT